MKFQFTPLREGRLAPAVRESPLELFQFTPLREGRRQGVPNYIVKFSFQFTPLREGRHGGYQVNAPEDEEISIHAPPRGATLSIRCKRF